MRAIAAGLLAAVLLLGAGGLAHAADSFTSLARKSPTLKTALAAYTKARDELWKEMDSELGASVLHASIDDEDLEASLASEYGELFGSIDVRVLELTTAVQNASVSDKQGLLKAYKVWRDQEEQDIANAKDIGQRISFTQGSVELVWYSYYKLVMNFAPKRDAIRELASALSKAYVRAEGILALETDAKRFKVEAALFLSMTYNAKTLVQALKHHQEIFKETLKEATPEERFGGKVGTAKRLVKEAKFNSRGWSKSLEAGVKKLRARLDEVQKLREDLEPALEFWIDETILIKRGKPFDKAKYDEIVPAFGAIYGQLKARSI